MAQPYPTHGHAASGPAAWAVQPAKGLAVAAAVLAGLGAFIEVVDVPLAWLAGEQLRDATARGVPPSEVITAFDVMACRPSGSSSRRGS